MNLLLWGPPASGKSHAALARFRAIPDSCLVTPTSTMAEHIGHELARSGFPVRPSQVTTLAGFVDSWELPRPASRPLLHALIEQALTSLKPARFAPVAEFRGFQAALADLLEEAPEELLGSCGDELSAVLIAVRQELRARGMALRQSRLRAAAARVRSGEGSPPAHIVFDGFFAFSPAELELLDALAERADLTVTLPASLGAAEARLRLERIGFESTACETPWRAPKCTIFSAAAAEREAEEIARRILDHAKRGRAFREMGIVLRSREPYGPLLETTLARFGIPVRSYFAEPLDRHPVVRFLAGSVQACLEGWNHEDILKLMRMPASGRGATAEGDQADFAARASLPGRGLPYAGMEPLGAIESMRRDRLEPLEWAERMRSLRSLIPAPLIGEHSSREQVDAWRSTAEALRAFDRALEQAASVFPPTAKLTLAAFWKQVETVLALEPLRIPGNRRESVHIMDVFEARQWELPVVFVCGLLERHFPACHGEDPVLGEALRRKLGLITAEQRNAEERFLFNLAVSRATEEVVLSYSRFDEKGDKTLPSFFLEGAAGKPCEGHVQPQPERVVEMGASGPIQTPALLRDLAKLHRKVSPSGIESFLQCPFQFFAGKTLRLQERPPAPRDRLNFLVKGNIVHKALAEWTAMPLLRGDILNRVFEDECTRLRIPRTYRTEAARLELLRHFEAFLEEGRLALGWRTEAEVKFELPISPELTIRGRIDRLDIGPDNQALVIDYKYSAAQKVRERVKASDAGELVQAGAYLLAAEQVLKLNPVGMLYCGLKKEIVWEGWHVPLQGLEDKGTVGTAESLREQMQATLTKIYESHQAIVSGRLEVKPTDDDKCRFCDFRDACRVESMERAVEIGAAP